MSGFSVRKVFQGSQISHLADEGARWMGHTVSKEAGPSRLPFKPHRADVEDEYGDIDWDDDWAEVEEADEEEEEEEAAAPAKKDDYYSYDKDYGGGTTSYSKKKRGYYDDDDSDCDDNYNYDVPEPNKDIQDGLQDELGEISRLLGKSINHLAFHPALARLIGYCKKNIVAAGIMELIRWPALERLFERTLGTIFRKGFAFSTGRYPVGPFTREVIRFSTLALQALEPVFKAFMAGKRPSIGKQNNSYSYRYGRNYSSYRAAMDEKSDLPTDVRLDVAKSCVEAILLNLPETLDEIASQQMPEEVSKGFFANMLANIQSFFAKLLTSLFGAFLPDPERDIALGIQNGLADVMLATKSCGYDVDKVLAKLNSPYLDPTFDERGAIQEWVASHSVGEDRMEKMLSARRCEELCFVFVDTAQTVLTRPDVAEKLIKLSMKKTRSEVEKLPLDAPIRSYYEAIAANRLGSNREACQSFVQNAEGALLLLQDARLVKTLLLAPVLLGAAKA